MGVDAGDADEDGLPDFVVTNFNDEFHSLFLNSRSYPYRDWTARSRLAAYTSKDVGWGVHFLDYDNEGSLDLVVCNGHINEVIELSRPDVKYKQVPLLLHNNGQAVFQNEQATAGPAFRTGYNARG
jgi:enediyne biosynthesis protein E4